MGAELGHTHLWETRAHLEATPQDFSVSSDINTELQHRDSDNSVTTTKYLKKQKLAACRLWQSGGWWALIIDFCFVNLAVLNVGNCSVQTNMWKRAHK